MMPATKVKRNKTTLRKAAKLIQAAHDRIEVQGFDIWSYEPDWDSGTNIKEIQGPCCYIGNLRLCAGVGPYPDEQGAALGDGDELYLALEAMDGVAKRRMRRWGLLPKQIDREYQFFDGTYYEDPTGRFVEKLGFQVANKYSDPEVQQNYALKLLRAALTDIYKEVEAK
jgi:hypothetical protein